jgi:hypothetical protein
MPGKTRVYVAVDGGRDKMIEWFKNQSGSFLFPIESIISPVTVSADATEAEALEVGREFVISGLGYDEIFWFDDGAYEMIMQPELGAYDDDAPVGWQVIVYTTENDLVIEDDDDDDEN